MAYWLESLFDRFELKAPNHYRTDYVALRVIFWRDFIRYWSRRPVSRSYPPRKHPAIETQTYKPNRLSIALTIPAAFVVDCVWRIRNLPAPVRKHASR